MNEQLAKCPLCSCGGKVEIIEVLNEDEEISYASHCEICGLSLWRIFPSQWHAANGWADFVEGFPRTMRVYPGDKIMTLDGHVRTIVSKDVERGTITVTTAYKHKHMYATTEIKRCDVKAWPWQLNKEGNPKK